MAKNSLLNVKLAGSLGRASRLVAVGFLLSATAACNPHPAPGPDKQGGGMIEGAALGAGAGAVFGAQVSAGTGPGVAVGAGLGAIAGAINGMVQDSLERETVRLAEMTEAERQRAQAHKILAAHFDRRLRLHPTRDIYPADLFFSSDKVSVRPEAKMLVKEIARLNEDRLPWSRLVVACYVKSRNPKEKNFYARKLAEQRAQSLGNSFVGAGIDPRRIEARAVLVDGPLVVDQQDDPLRYNQAIEIIPYDR